MSSMIERDTIAWNAMIEHDTIAWNAMIEHDTIAWHAIAEEGERKIAFQMYKQMHQEGVLPEEPTYVCILSTCAIHSICTECKNIHAQVMVRKCVLDLALGHALLNTTQNVATLKIHGSCFRTYMLQMLFRGIQ